MIEVVQGLSRLSRDVLPPSTRQRVVWTKDEKKRLDRCSKDFNAHGDKLKLVCGNPACPDTNMKLHEDQANPGGMVLRCGCSDRIFSQHF